MKPKKLIRKNIIEKLKEGEWEIITDQTELNNLYALKVSEELAEIQQSEHKDIMEFVDLIQVAFSFAKQNGFTHEQLAMSLVEKSIDKGTFSRLALNNLNPSNPSNKLYFQQPQQFQEQQTVTDRPKVNMVVDYLEACCNELADCNNTEDEFQVFVKYEDLILSHLFPSQPSEKKPLEEITDEEEAERVYAIYRDEHPDTDLPNDYIFQWLLMKRFLQKGEIRNEND